MSKKTTARGQKIEVTLVRSSVAECLTFVAVTGKAQTSVELCHEIENTWLTQKMMATSFDVSVVSLWFQKIQTKAPALPIPSLLPEPLSTP